MYSKYHNGTDRPIQIPKHYSGVAFSEKAQKPSEPPTVPRQLEVAKPSPPAEHIEKTVAIPPPRPILLPPTAYSAKGAEPSCESHAPPPPPVSDSAAPPQEPPKSKPTEGLFANAAFLQPFRGLFGQVGTAFPFSHGLGFEELLLLGLIVLLAGNQQGSDIVLWLTLLLFCG